MKLKKISIRNLRGLQNIEFDTYNLTTIIGKNNCGKSSVLRGIELLCTGVKPDMEEFYLRTETIIEIEGTFHELKEWERSSPAISALVYNNELRLKYVATISTEEDEKKKITIEYFAFKEEEQINGWQDEWNELGTELKAIAQEMNIKTATQFKTKANKEKVKQIIRDKYPDKIVKGNATWSGESIPFNNSLQQALPKIIIIPAVKDASDESKYSKTGKSAFGELMRRLILPQIQGEKEYENIIKAISALSDRIHSEDGFKGINDINNKLSERLSRLIDAKANVKFDNPEIDTVISSSVGLRIVDGVHDTPIGLQGHGLQRTLIFSLLEMVGENEAAINDENSRTTIILYEEPELYLHPQMLRKLKEIFNIISISENWQVICTSHSPVFINVADVPKSLVILSRTTIGNISLKQLTENPFDSSEVGKIERDALRAALDFHPTVCEAFFASKVILVEGDTEMAIFKHCPSLLEYCGVNVVSSLDCTIVSCGGKWTIPAVGRLLSKFGIAFKVVHDLDRLGKTDRELADLPAIHPFKANSRISIIVPSENIFICEDTLEDLWNGSKNDKPYSAIRKSIELVKNKLVPNRLVDLVRFVYSDFLNESTAGNLSIYPTNAQTN
ncbi:AAA family ATPase [Longitalea arenae]|uniref:AAA family ATPase n=1 Tax=Longitalea arenae TaxID=2812558 RepID=UPI001966D70D|nr:ATP-dependent endonuclease [Longitalea arenae]